MSLRNDIKSLFALVSLKEAKKESIASQFCVDILSQAEHLCKETVPTGLLLHHGCYPSTVLVKQNDMGTCFVTVLLYENQPQPQKPESMTFCKTDHLPKAQSPKTVGVEAEVSS